MIRIPTPLAVGPVNAVLLPGNPLTLVDCGPDTREAYAAVRDGLAEAGSGIADLDRIVISHAHIDHCGLAARLQTESGARVLAHPRAIEDMADWPATWARRLELVARAARAGAVPEAVIEQHLERVEPLVALGRSLPRDTAIPLADGQQPLLAGRRWRCIYTPGHAPDHLCLHDPVAAELIGGDLLLRHLPTPPLLEASRASGDRPETLADLIASWRRIGQLELNRVLPGHGSSLRAHRIQLARRLAETRDGVRRTRRALIEGARTLWEVGQATDLPTTPERLALVLGHVVARLDWLVARGLAERSMEGGELRFEPRSPRRRANRGR